MTRCAAVLVAACWCAHVGAEDPLALSPGTEPVPIAGHIFVLRDDSAALTLEQVRSPELAARFERSESDAFNFGYGQAAYWFRVDLRAPPGNSSTWVVDIGLPILDYLDVHVTHADGRTVSFLTGDRRSPPAGQLAHRRFAIPFPLAAEEAATLHVRMTNGAVLLYDMSLWSAAGFQQEAAADHLRFGIIIGVLLLLILYNALVYLSIRDRAYFWFVLQCLALGCLMMMFGGYARLYGNALTPAAPVWISNSFPVLVFCANVSFTLFATEFMQTRLNAPVMHRLLLILGLLNLAIPIAYVSVSYGAAVRVSNILSALGVALIVWLTVRLSLKGVRSARLYLLAFSVAILAFIANLLEVFGVLGTAFFNNFGWMFGATVSGALFSLALADRIVMERRERTRFSRLKQYLPQRVAELVMEGQGGALLEPKRRNVTVCVIDLRGFTPFSETAAPEDVMAVLREFYDTMGAIVEKHGGTVEHFAGDSMLIFFNAPLEIPEPEKQAVQTALEMRDAFEPLRQKWQKLGHELGLGIGIADGYATIGAIGFSGRSQYAAIGAVTNLASRLCSIAQHGEILTTPRVLTAVEHLVDSESAGEQAIKGFSRPVQIARVSGFKTEPALTPAAGVA